MKIFSLTCRSIWVKHNPAIKLANTFKHNFITSIRIGCGFSSSKIGIIASMTEVQQAVHFYEQKNITSAL